TEAGADRVLTMDLHAAQIQAFFDIPVDHLYASRLFIDHFSEHPIDNLVVVAPDVGSLKMSRAYAKRLGTQLAFIDKRRPKQNVAEVMNIIGEVEGKNVLIVDDLIDTAGTLTNAASALKERGALNIIATCTHPILSGPAYQRIEDSPIDQLLVTDTVPLRKPSNKIKVLSVAGIFAEAIQRIHTNDTISAPFDESTKHLRTMTTPEIIRLNGKTRQICRNVTEALRDAMCVPGVLYGPEVDEYIHFTIDELEFEKIL